MLLELTHAAKNLDEAKLESELADRSLQQAEENRRVSKSQYEVGLETLSDLSLIHISPLSSPANYPTDTPNENVAYPKVLYLSLIHI